MSMQKNLQLATEYVNASNEQEYHNCFSAMSILGQLGITDNIAWPASS